MCHCFPYCLEVHASVMDLRYENFLISQGVEGIRVCVYIWTSPESQQSSNML